MSEPVSIQFEIADEVIDYHDIRGGIRIDAGGTRVNRLRDEENYESNCPWQPEYVGELLTIHVSGLIDRATRLAEGAVDVGETVDVNLSPGLGTVVVEPISREELVVSYRVATGADMPAVVPASARGYVVRRCQFCRAVRDAAHEYVEEVEAMGLEFGRSLFDEFQQSLDDLDTALETCYRTTPDTHF
ncbi:hypothetical protein RYH80_01720 [Halobaculum sp. MBLA0147]|uniref:hypothetical protein n=1 Tax=Halobaculum sp. MBLA0147 TaxID=3079934 RepID=UPI0035259302